MTNFSINFTYPWFLLLLIPAVGVTLITYFRVSKKYRKTRNRITSMVLNIVGMTLCIAVLAGMNFSYDLPNTENEVILLVDRSASGEKVQEEKDEFVQAVVDKLSSGYKIGVVTFGFDQVYAVELTTDAASVYDRYLQADLPDDSATDIAAALTYARTLFSNPQSGKIVLIGDGLETDEEALSVVKAVAADGIIIDTAYFADDGVKTDIQLQGVSLPDYNVAVGETFSVSVDINSTFEGEAVLTVYDNDQKGNSVTFTAEKGEQTVSIEHYFALPGLHSLRFEVQCAADKAEENNVYYTYKYLEVFDKLLIIDGGHTEGETGSMETLLAESSYEVTVRKIGTDVIPSTVRELQEYDQVILMNVAEGDMPDGLEDALYTYVHDIGGGLFTVGGSKTDESGEEVGNAYNRADLYGTTYQDMLPVEAINYTPPVAVMIIIDSSGSMATEDSTTGKTYFELAQEGAISCLNSLTERDYCGVMVFETEYEMVQDIQPVTQRYKIAEAIDALTLNYGGTTYSTAIEYAGRALMAVKNVERRHIILVSDGEPTESSEYYQYYTQLNYENAGITLSLVQINGAQINVSDDVKKMVELGNGRLYDVWDPSTLPSVMREELTVDEIKEVIYEDFTPTISNYTAIVSGISQKDMPVLQGYYGTKAKSGATVVLSGAYVPIYAQWKYGEGMVGSFMCDLNGTWSASFLASETGQIILKNIILALFPTESIRYSEIEAVFREDNYHTQVSVYTSVEEGESIRVTITEQLQDGQVEPTKQVFTPTSAEDYSRINFILTQPGIHTVLIEKLNADGVTEAKYSTYRVLSYSEEYDLSRDVTEGKELLEKIAASGKGNVLEDAWDVLENIERKLHKEYDPVIPFIIIAIVLFLLDIAVRKFKFKWIHELIRERKDKQALARKATGGEQ
jgi:hypothetical protein